MFIQIRSTNLYVYLVYLFDIHRVFVQTKLFVIQELARYVFLRGVKRFIPPPLLGKNIKFLRGEGNIMGAEKNIM